jgi:hypothetical protein
MTSLHSPGPGHRLFVVIVAGDVRLGPDHYALVAAALDAAIVFDGGGEAKLVRCLRQKGLKVRVVNVAGLLAAG